MYMNKANNRPNPPIICNARMNNRREVPYSFNELYRAVCFAIAAGIPAVEISRNNAYILYPILNNPLAALAFSPIQAYQGMI